MNTPNDFFTLQTLATFSGITVAVTVIYNTFRSLINKESKFIAFLISLFLCFVVAWATLKQPIDYVVTLLNGCLVYCTAMGLNIQVNRAIPPIPTPTPSTPMTLLKNQSANVLPHEEQTMILTQRINHFFKPW